MRYCWLPVLLRSGAKRTSPRPNLAKFAVHSITCMAQQEPFPAVAVDRHWNLLKSNSGAVRLVEFLVGPLAPDTPINLADALVAPDVLRPFLVNWADVVRYFIRSVEADAAADGTPETAALLERLLAYEGVRSAVKAPTAELAITPVLPMHFRKGNTTLRLFTTIATLGTPQDITLQELRVECFFPMDDETNNVLRAWCAETNPSGPVAGLQWSPGWRVGASAKVGRPPSQVPFDPRLLLKPFWEL